MKPKFIKYRKDDKDWPEQALKDIVRLGEDIQTLCEGENQSVVLNVLINLYVGQLIAFEVKKDDVIERVSRAYDIMKTDYDKRKK